MAASGISFEFSKDQLHKAALGDSGAPDPLRNFTFLLALDGNESPNPEWGWPEKALDFLVKAAQPAPAVTHVELLLPPTKGGGDMHFATYIGQRAGFGSSFENQRSFYLGNNAGNWRAIPIVAERAAERVRAECEKHVGTSYSLVKYLCAVPPFRALAPFVPDAVQSPAHCATLTARCLRAALPEIFIQHSSPWYGPTTLSLELSSDSHISKVRDEIEAKSHEMSLGEEEELDQAVYKLLHGSDADITSLSSQVVGNAVFKLVKRTTEAGLDDVALKITQKQLATSLIRYSCVG